jgi:hypothetical protein
VEDLPKLEIKAAQGAGAIKNWPRNTYCFVVLPMQAKLLSFTIY